MKKVVTLFLLLWVVVGCSDATGSDSDSLVRIGLGRRNYKYVEVVANEHQYGIYFTGAVEAIDTFWIDVPSVDTLTLIPLLDVNRYYRVHPVNDSVYHLR